VPAEARRLLDPLRDLPWVRAAAPWVWTAAYAVRIRREARRARRVPDPFDREHGVRTRVVPGVREFWRMFLRGGLEHEPSRPDRFREIVESLDVQFETTVFADIGSGAGRVVLMASEYPFKEVVGIELSRSLHATAEQNVLAFPAARRQAGAVRLLCADATEFVLPPEPLVLYLYNPFGVTMMRRLVRNIEASLVEQYRPVTIVLAYCYKDTRRLMEQSRLLKVVSVDRGITVLRSLTPSELVTPAPVHLTASETDRST
jgi:predicted RNA methylase